jgi:hypothetical protein
MGSFRNSQKNTRVSTHGSNSALAFILGFMPIDSFPPRKKLKSIRAHDSGIADTAVTDTTYPKGYA